MSGTDERQETTATWLLVGLVALVVLGALALFSLHPNQELITSIRSPRSWQIWLGAIATLMLYSVLYKENPYYRFAEHALLGLAAGYGVYQIWNTNLFQNWFEPLFRQGQWGWTLALVAGAMYFTIYHKRLSWMSRMVMLFLLATNAGLYFRMWAGDYMAQIGDSFRPLITAQFPFVHLNNLIFVATLVAVMVYFLFSFEQKQKAVRQTAAAGRWLMMIAFGAMFGSTVMARLSLFIGRLTFLFQDWIHLIRN